MHYLRPESRKILLSPRALSDILSEWYRPSFAMLTMSPNHYDQRTNQLRRGHTSLDFRVLSENGWVSGHEKQEYMSHVGLTSRMVQHKVFNWNDHQT